MDRKQMVVANVKYQSAKGKGAGKLKQLARYIQYRDDKHGHLPQKVGLERWVDKGLGNNFGAIAAQCDDLKSEHVQGFTWVIAPNVDLIAFVPETQRGQFVKDLTESTVQHFLEERGIDGLEWSYAIHHRETTDKHDPGRDNPHAHIILPGTYYSWADGARLPLYMNRSKRENHIEMLHDIAQAEMGMLMDRYVGLDWEQRYDALIAERQQEIETALIQTPRWKLITDDLDLNIPAPDAAPHAIYQDKEGQDWGIWVGWQPDLFEAVQHVGFIMRGEIDGETVHEFVPKVHDMTPEQAAEFADYLVSVTERDGINAAIRFAEYAGQLETTERAAFFNPPTRPMNQNQEIGF